MRKKYGVIVVVIGYIFFFFCMEGWGANWRYAFRTVHQDTLIDFESISRLPDNIIRVWEKNIVTDKGREYYVESSKQVKFINLDHFIVLTEYHCTWKKTRVLSVVFYSKDGTILHSSESPGNWGFIFPGSAAEYIFKEVCK